MTKPLSEMSHEEKIEFMGTVARALDPLMPDDEVFACFVFPGDDWPQFVTNGQAYNMAESLRVVADNLADGGYDERPRLIPKFPDGEEDFPDLQERSLSDDLRYAAGFLRSINLQWPDFAAHIIETMIRKVEATGADDPETFFDRYEAMKEADRERN
jgi:hypothetical protein